MARQHDDQLRDPPDHPRSILQDTPDAGIADDDVPVLQYMGKSPFPTGKTDFGQLVSSGPEDEVPPPEEPPEQDGF